MSVQAVCDRATVGRSTFYAHYADKEELLLSGFDQLLSELRAHVRREATEPAAKSARSSEQGCTTAASARTAQGSRPSKRPRTRTRAHTERAHERQDAETVGRRPPAGTLAFVTPLVAHVDSHRRLYRALAGERTAQQVRRRLLAVIGNMLEGEQPGDGQDTARRQATVRYIAGACVELLSYWLDGRSGLDAHEVARLLHQLTAAIVHEAERTAS